MKEQQISPVIRAFLNAYLTRRNVSETLAFLTENICWIGCGEKEKAFGIEQVEVLLQQDADVLPIPVMWELCGYHELFICPDAAQILCFLKLNDPTSMHQTVDMRVSFSCIKTIDGFRICAIHGSAPLVIDRNDGFFPISYTERKLRKTLMDSQKELTTLLKTIQAGIAVLQYKDGKLVPVYFNQGICRMLNANEEEIKAIYKLDAYAGVHPEDRERIITSFEDSVKNCSQFNETYRLFNYQGEARWISACGMPIERTDGTFYCYMLYTDLTAERKMLEEARLREESVQIAVQQTNLNIWIFDLATHTMSQQRNCQLRNEFSTMETIPNVPECFIAAGCIEEEDIPVVRQMYKDILSGKPHTECVARWYTDYGKRVSWLKTTYTLVCDEQGKPYMAIGTALDVSKQIQLERQYREFEVYQHLMLDSSFAAFKINITHDTLEEAIHFGSKLNKMAEAKTFTQFCKLSCLNIFDEALRVRHQEIFSGEHLLHSFEAGQTHLEFECLYQIDETTLHWVRLVMNMALNPSTGDVIGFTYGNDIHDEKLMELVLIHLLEYNFDQVLCINTNTGMLRFLDQQGEGRNAFSTVEIDYSQLFSHNIQNAVHPDDWSQYKKCFTLSNIIEHLAQSSLYVFSIRAFLPSGEPCIKKFSFSYLDVDKCTILFTSSDITQIVRRQNEQNKQLETALKEIKRASAAKSEFLSRMSHDIRTPMNAILSFSSMELDSNTSFEQLAADMQQINHAGQYLLGLINDVLDMSKIENQKMELHLQAVRPSQCLRAILATIEPLMKNKKLKFEIQIDLPKTEPILMLDIMRTKQLFINLLSNAAKFTPEGGAVTFCILQKEQTEQYIVLNFVIRDTGIGMSKEFQKHLFAPFSQERREYIEQTEGTGLGLAIVKQLVTLMDGTIDVKSELNKGTEFIIELKHKIVSEIPCAPTAALSHDAVNKNTLEGKRVLLCEDHPINAAITKRLLLQKNIEVEHVENGQRGVELFATSSLGYYDAVLMDVKMPVMNGLEATKAIRALPRGDAKTTPIIAMTANAFADDVQASLEAGMNSHLSKPIEPQKFYQVLSQFFQND